jgi:hypothetical protein
VQIPDSAVPADQVLQQPWNITRFDVTQFRWVGGDNWTDNPVVAVQRQVHGDWQPYADQSGEVVTFLDNPGSMAADATSYRQGTQEWHWRAAFEAFDAYPRADVPGGQVPSGTYRFVVDGKVHTGGQVHDYHLTSAPFTVSPWTGIAVRDLRRDDSTTVSFAVDPIVYPRMPTAAHAAGIAFYKDDGGGRGTPGAHLTCRTCTFRPWATTGTVKSAFVQVTHSDGSTENVPAHLDDASGRWVATIPADTVSYDVPNGSVRDSYGESNGVPPAPGPELPEVPWAPLFVLVGLGVLFAVLRRRATAR